MSTPIIAREQIIQALINVLEPLDYVYAMWEGGAAAFNRIDQWSDLDLQVDAADKRSADVFTAIEQALTTLSPIDLKFELPEPTWHGHAQTFYRLRDTSPFHFLDVVVLKHSNPAKFLEPEIHGQATVYFDKANVVQIPPLDKQAFAVKLQDRLATLAVTFDLFQVLTLKELNRHNHLEALHFYHGYTLRPLVELLRMKYKPTQYNFNTRYLYYDFPPDVVGRLETLFFVTNSDDIRAKRREAEQLFYQTLTELEQKDWSL